MNNEYLYRAKEKIGDSQTLIILASQRAADLAKGARPMVRCDADNFLDVALLEIAEGLLEADFNEKVETDNILKELEAAKAAAAGEIKTEKKD